MCVYVRPSKSILYLASSFPGNIMEQKYYELMLRSDKWILFTHALFNSRTPEEFVGGFAEPFQEFGPWAMNTKSMNWYHFNVKWVISLASSCSRFLISQRTQELTNLTLHWHLALEWPEKSMSHECIIEFELTRLIHKQEMFSDM